MPWSEPWSHAEKTRLAKYVTPNFEQMRLDVSARDEWAADTPSIIVEKIYGLLLEKDIRYELEPYHFEKAAQVIRTPAEVLNAPRIGTCLDLAIVFCGICLQNDLLPVLVVLKGATASDGQTIPGHALVLVSMTTPLHNWNSVTRPQFGAFSDGILTNERLLRQLVEDKNYIAIECTGFASSRELSIERTTPPPECVGRDVITATLPFSRAREAGEEQLGCFGKSAVRSLDFALDIAVLHSKGVDPFSQIVAEGNSSTELEDLYLSPRQVYDRVHLTDFVGRRWLETNLDAFLDTQNSGVWLLVGEAGIGKTTFLAHIAQTRDYPHFFAEQAPHNVNRALQSLVAQLITRYSLQDYVGRKALSQGNSVSPDFFVRIMYQVADRLPPGKRLVLVIDGLDEAGVMPGGNVLGLPTQLPTGVYLILSQRPQEVPLHISPHPFRVNVSTHTEGNLDDIKAFAGNVASIPAVSQQLMARGYHSNEFVDALAERSNGNWMYLHYIVEEIRQGMRAPLDLTTLPDGLVGYYAQYWVRWRSRRKAWDRWYAPLLAAITALFEPVEPALLKEVTKVGASVYEIAQLLENDWRAFFQCIDEGGHQKYRPYHASLREFLTGMQTSTRFTVEEEHLLQDLRQRAKSANEQVVKFLKRSYHSNLGQGTADPYALKYLSTHLRLSGPSQITELQSLLEDEDWYRVHMAADPSGATYQNDVDQAWTLFEEVNRSALEQGKIAEFVGYEVNCAIYTSSLNRLARNIPASLLVALVDKHLWTGMQALGITRRNTDPVSKYDALIGLMPHLPVEQQQKSLKEAVDLAFDIYNLPTQRAALEQLKSRLTPPLLEHALSRCMNIDDPYRSARLLPVFFSVLPDEKRNQLLSYFLELTAKLGVSGRVRARADIVPALSPAERQQLWLDAVRLREVDEKLNVLITLLPFFLPEERAERAKIAFESLERSKLYVIRKSRYLERLRPYLPTDLHTIADKLKIKLQTEIQWEHSPLSSIHIDEASSNLNSPLAPYEVSENPRPWWLGDDLAKIPTAIGTSIETVYLVRRHLSQSSNQINASQADQLLEACRRIRFARPRSALLAAIAPSLSPDQLKEALAIARTNDDGVEQAQLLAQIAMRLPVAGVDNVVDNALDMIENDVRIQRRAQALIAQPESLSPEQAIRAWQLALNIPFIEDRRRALEHIAAELPTHFVKESFQVMQNALSSPQRFGDPSEEDAISTLKKLGRDAGVILAAIAPKLPDALISEAWELAKQFSAPEERARALAALAPRLPESLLESTLLTLESRRSAEVGSQIVAAVAAKLPPERRLKPVQTAVKLAMSIRNASTQVQTLVSLLPYTPISERPSIVKRALDHAKFIKRPFDRVSAWVSLFSYLSETESSMLSDASLHLARNLPESECGRIVAAIAPKLPDALISEAWELAKQFSAPEERARALAALAPRLPEPLLRELWVSTISLEDTPERATRLEAIIPHLDKIAQNEAFALTLATEDTEARQHLLTLWARVQSHTDRQRVYDEIWTKTAHALAQRSRNEALMELRAMVPIVEMLGGVGAVDEIARAVSVVGKRWP